MRDIVVPVVLVRPHPLETDEEPPVGASRIGGRPDLAGHAWPVDAGEALPFLAQIDLADVHPHDEDRRFPATGLLSFFGRFQEDREWQGAAVFEPNTALLRRAPPPQEARFTPDDLPGPCRLTFTAGFDTENGPDWTLTDEHGERRSLLYDVVYRDPQWQALDAQRASPHHGGLSMLGGEFWLVVDGLVAEGPKVLVFGMVAESAGLPGWSERAVGFYVDSRALAAGRMDSIWWEVGQGPD